MEIGKNKSYDINDELSQKEWQLIDDNVIIFQKQFLEGASTDDIVKAEEASNHLLYKFSPLFKKYLSLIKHGQIDFTDKEMKQFIALFIDDYELKKALNRKKQRSEYKAEIYRKFNFILETYGTLGEEDIISDLKMCFLILCKRYRNVGKNFCAYVYNSYRYEVARHIKKFTKDAGNIKYKLLHYEDSINGQFYEDAYHEDNMGLPDYTWINGQGCSDIFLELSTIQRKILIKYYLEDWNDKQIADFTGLHINTINQKRRAATKYIADKTGMSLNDILRSRKSGRKASLPTTL